MRYIYVYQNDVNGKCYVGQTHCLYKREKDHRNTPTNYPFHCAIKKYGWHNFSRILTLKVPMDECDAIEYYLMGALDTLGANGYNRKGAGEQLHSHSEQSKRLMSERYPKAEAWQYADVICEKYQSGAFDCVDLGNLYGCNRRTIARILQKHGVPRRKTSSGSGHKISKARRRS